MAPIASLSPGPRSSACGLRGGSTRRKGDFTSVMGSSSSAPSSWPLCLGWVKLYEVLYESVCLKYITLLLRNLNGDPPSCREEYDSYIYIHLHRCTHPNKHTHTQTLASVPTPISTQIHTCVFTDTCSHRYLCLFPHIHTYRTQTYSALNILPYINTHVGVPKHSSVCFKSTNVPFHVVMVPKCYLRTGSHIDPSS